MESCRSFRESATITESFLETALRNCCSVISMPYLSALFILSLCSSCFVVSSISSVSFFALDCLAAILAAEVITLDFNFSSKAFSFLGIPRGIVVFY